MLLEKTLKFELFMCRNSPPLVFICYSHKDRDKAQNICKKLQSQGIDYWIDYDQIEFGEDIIEGIENGLNKCDCILVLISNSYNKSEWTKSEYRSMLVKQIKSHKTLIVPVLLEEGCELPTLVISKKYIDLVDFQKGESLLQEFCDQLINRVNLASS